jgi:hypothetical protein
MMRLSQSQPRQFYRQGAVLVELALLLPLLLLLMLATVEFAQALATYKGVVNQVRSAARYASTKAPGTGHIEVECLLTRGSMSTAKPCAGSVLLPGFASASFTVTVTDAANSPASHRAQRTSTDLTVNSATTINLVTITATGYQHPLSFAAFFPGIVGNASVLTFGAISMTMRQTS